MDSLFKICQQLILYNQDSSFKILDNLILQAKDNNYQKRLGNYYCLKGKSLLVNNNSFEESLKYFILADKSNQLIQNKELEIEIKHNLAFYYCKNQEFDHAKKYISAIKNEVNNTKDKLLKSKVYNTIGSYYIDLAYFTEEDVLDSAIFFFKKSLEIAKRNGFLNLLTSNYIYLGNSYFDKEDFDKSISYYSYAQKESELSNDSLGVAAAISNIGSVYFEKNNFSKAIEYYNKAKDIFVKQKNPKGNYMTLYLLADAYAKINKFKPAYYNHVSATQLYDSIFSEEKQKIIDDLLVKYETEKKEDEIIIKNKKLALEKVKTKNRNITIYTLAGIMVLLIIIIAFIIQNIKNRNQLMAKEIELKNQEITKLLKDQELKSYESILEGQENERQRIAADLHDKLGGLLSTIKAYFSVIEEKIITLEENTIKQHKIASTLLNTAVEEVRNISHDLHSGVLKNFGLILAVEDLKNTIELSGALQIELNIVGKNQDIDVKKEIEIYRIIQELFSNTIKHAKANNVTIQFVFEEKQLNIIFEDDGVGFDIEKATKGIGLKNIEARTKKLYADLNIDSRIGRGTIIIIDIPIT